MKKNRNVGIVGVGQTVFSSHREEVNQPELVREGVALALEHAGLTMDDIDCVIHGNMELFEMVAPARPVAFPGQRSLRQGDLTRDHRRHHRGHTGLHC